MWKVYIRKGEHVEGEQAEGLNMWKGEQVGGVNMWKVNM